MYVGGFIKILMSADLNWWKVNTMSKELCFCVENKNLYLEHVLVDYMDIPIFFLCKNGNQYYLVLCVDVEELNYIIVKVLDSDVYDLLHGKIPMRNVILKAKEYWEVSSGEEIYSDKVIKRETVRMDVSLLPEENACFKILTEEMKLFVQKFDNEFFDTEHFSINEKKIDLDETLLNVLNDLLDEEIEKFVSVGDYSFKSWLKQTSASADNFNAEYVPHIERKAKLQRSTKLENWKNDDVINAAA